MQGWQTSLLSLFSCIIRGGQANFFEKSINPQILGLIPLSQIRKFIVCDTLPIANPQIFFMINPQMLHTSVLIVLIVLFLKFTNLNLSIICHIFNEKKNVFADLRKFKVHKSQKDWVRKSQIRKVPLLRNISKSNKLFKHKKLQICDLRNLFVGRPLLSIINMANVPVLTVTMYNVHVRWVQGHRKRTLQCTAVHGYGHISRPQFLSYMGPSYNSRRKVIAVAILYIRFGY